MGSAIDFKPRGLLQAEQLVCRIADYVGVDVYDYYENSESRRGRHSMRRVEN